MRRRSIIETLVIISFVVTVTVGAVATGAIVYIIAHFLFKFW